MLCSLNWSAQKAFGSERAVDWKSAQLQDQSALLMMTNTNEAGSISEVIGRGRSIRISA